MSEPDLFVATPLAPKAIGPYSQAVRALGLLFCSGQIALDPQSGTLLEGDVRAQTERVLQNLKAVLEAAGTTLAGVVKTTVYLVDMADFSAMNEVYAKAFSTKPPARSTVAVKELPKGARVEIDVIAVAD